MYLSHSPTAPLFYTKVHRGEPNLIYFNFKTMNNNNNTPLSFWDRAFGCSTEFNRYGITAILFLIIGCLGGVSVGLGAVESITQLSATVFSTIIVLALSIAVQPMKWILNATAVAILIDLILITYNIL